MKDTPNTAEAMHRVLSNVAYAKDDYEKEMGQDALLNEATNEIKIVWRTIDDKMILYFHCASKGRKTSLFPQQSVVSFEMDTKHELVSGEIGCGFSYLYQSTMGICRKLKQGKNKMAYKYIYKTPEDFSDIILNSDGENLTGLYFESSRGLPKHLMDCVEENLAIFRETSHWLDIYFHGKNPDFIPKYKIANLTPFRQQVIDIMNTIKFGETLTYNDIAKMIATEKGLETESLEQKETSQAMAEVSKTKSHY